MVIDKLSQHSFICTDYQLKKKTEEYLKKLDAATKNTEPDQERDLNIIIDAKTSEDPAKQ